MHRKGIGNSVTSDTTTEQNGNLESWNSTNNTNEHEVGCNTFHEVDFIINFPGTEHVEDLKPDKQVENNC